MNPKRSQYRAHPAYVLKEVADAADPSPTPAEDLGLRWLELSRTEKREREQAFFSVLLTRLGAEPGATFKATFQELGEADAFAGRWKAQQNGCSVSGRSADELARELAGARLAAAHIQSADGTPLFKLKESWSGVQVWLEDDRWTQWYTDLEAALRRRPGAADSSEHPARAALFIVIARAAWIISSLLGVGVMWLLSKNGVSLPVAVVIGFIVLAILILWPAQAVRTRALERLL